MYLEDKRFDTADEDLTIRTWARNNLDKGVTIHKLQQGGKDGIQVAEIANFRPSWNNLVTESDGGTFRETWGPRLRKEN